MDGKPERTRAPLPWEEKAAIGCLAVLILQELHEAALFCLGKPSPGFHGTSSAFAILLVLFVSVAWGLVERSRIAWWVALGSLGAIGLTHLAVTWSSIAQSLEYRGRVQGALSYEWYQVGQRLEDFEIFWLGARNVLLIAVPALLILGAFRKSLQTR